MTNAQPPEEILVNDRALNKLIRAITLSQGNFSLILARCNYVVLRDHVVQQLKAQCPIALRELYLPASTKTLYTTIQSELGHEHPQALMIFGLESVAMVDQLLTSTNQVREEFRKHLSYPVVLWTNDDILKKLVKLAPDFKSWAATSIKFEISNFELVQAIKQTADATVAAILEAGSGRFFVDVSASFKGFSNAQELEFALQDAYAAPQIDTPRLTADLNFLLGLAADSKGSKADSRKFYEQSLKLWHGQLRAKTVSSNDYLHYSCLLFYLGVWWRQYATQNRAEYFFACSQAKKYYQECLEVFQQIDRPDLSAKFINALGEVLLRLEQWDALKTVTQKAISLHQVYSEPVRLAFGYALLAELALQQSDWKGAQQQAELALYFNDSEIPSEFDSEWNRQHYQSFYLLLLAQARKQIGQIQEAVANLEDAKANSDPQYDPLLYIRILKVLHAYHFEQGYYLKAFKVKQEQKLVEQQFGLRAFVGAGRLQARRQVNNPGLAPIDQHITVAQEIAASGRMQTINRLVERVSRSDCKLVIIHGQSGVGKSSTIQAGLIPVLLQKTFDAREALPILLQVYPDWDKNLASRLRDALKTSKGSSSVCDLNEVADILQQLRQNAELNLLTVLIFDQFEEFFFAYRDKKARDPFYEFINQCLNIPFVKIVCSLREDYLHYLLEFNRSYSLDILNRNILDKEILYHLGNFSQDDARSVIQSITRQSQSYLEPALIDELVRDLTEDDGEVSPIELQVVGTQLQAENITTLAQYEQHGPKRKLVENFLEEVIKDCGAENANIARRVLFLLTDDNGTRPLRTRTELAINLYSKDDINKLDLILGIFVESGLAFVLPEVSTELYQLVHDYLVTFIRQEEGTELTKKLRESEEKRRLSEAQLIHVNRRKRQLTLSIALITTVAILLSGLAIWALSERKNAEALAILASSERKNAEASELRSLVLSSENSFASNKEFDALLSSLRAAKLLKKGILADKNNSSQEVLSVLQKSIYQVREYNRLEKHSDSINDLSFSPDGKTIDSASTDGTVKIWDLNGKVLHDLGKDKKGHTNRVNRILFSHDKKLIATSSNDKTIKIWSVNGELIHTLIGHKDWVGDVAFSPNDMTIASVSSDGTIRFWASNSGVLIRTVPPTDKNADWLKVVRFSPDGRMVATGGYDGKIKLCSLDGKLIQSSERHGNSITDLEFSPDGKLIASSSIDATIKLWTLDGKLSKTLEGHHKPINQIEFSPIPGSNLLVSASQDKTVKLWNLDGQLLKTMSEHTAAVKDVRFSPDGKTIASASDDKTIKLWSLDGRLLKTLEGHTDGVNLVRFKSDGKTLASASIDKSIRLWNLGTTNNIQFLSKLSGNIVKVSFSQTGKIAVLANDDPKVWFYDPKGDWLSTLSRHYDAVLSADFRADSQQIATGSADGYLRVLDVSDKQSPLRWLATEQTLGSYTTSGIYVDTIENSPFLTVTGVDVDSPAAKAGIQVEDHIVEINGGSTVGMTRQDAYDLLDSKPGQNARLRLDRGGVDLTLSVDQQQVKWYASITAVAFSPKSALIASGSEDSFITLWDTTGKRLSKQKSGGTITGLSFSPDGKRFASVSTNETIMLWDSDEQSKHFGQMIWQGRHKKSVLAVAFSPDGKMIASAGEDRIIKLWSLKGEELISLPKTESNAQEGHDGRVNSVAFSPDGKMIASASEDRTVKLWNVNNGNLLATFYGHSAPVVAVHIGPDSQTITSIGADGSVIHWRPADLKLNVLFNRGCNWLHDYLSNVSDTPDAPGDRNLCAGVDVQKQP